MRFGNFPEETDQDYLPPEVKDFEYDLTTSFGYSEQISMHNFKKGEDDHDDAYCESHRFDLAPTPEDVEKPKARKLLQRLCFGS